MLTTQFKKGTTIKYACSLLKTTATILSFYAIYGKNGMHSATIPCSSRTVFNSTVLIPGEAGGPRMIFMPSEYTHTHISLTKKKFTYLSFLKGGVTCVSTQNGHKV
jgi:hypothetical protein